MSDDTTLAARAGRVPSAVTCVALTKPKQTALLLATAVGSFLLSAAPGADWMTFGVGMAALALSVSGCTVLNMVIDRDIDALMGRTQARPLPQGDIGARTAMTLGGVLSVAGLALAWLLSPLFGLVVTFGFVFDLLIYTLWLKRRTPLSIVFGGISGGMPALAGRALALGGVDLVGILLATGVVLWIPAHILTLSTRYAREYSAAGVPVWPGVYGPDATRKAIALATMLAAAALSVAGALERISPVAFGILVALGLGLSGLGVAAFVQPSEKRNWLLFKAASAYMLAAFTCLTLGAML